MQSDQPILAVLTACMPEIRHILGEERWPAFAERLRGHAALFQNVDSTADLMSAVNTLLALFNENQEVKKLIIKERTRVRAGKGRSVGERGSTLGSKPPPTYITIEQVAEDFITLCNKPELISRTDSRDRSGKPDELAAPTARADQGSAQVQREQPE